MFSLSQPRNEMNILLRLQSKQQEMLHLTIHLPSLTVQLHECKHQNNMTTV